MNNYDSIDLTNIKKQVIEYCAIEDSKTFILEEEVSFNPLIIRNNLNQTKEALDLLKDNFNLSFDGIGNLNDLFIKSKKDIPLNGMELANILSFHYHCDRIKRQLYKIEKELSIKDYADSILVFDDLAKKIDKVVDTNGNIKEDASDRLKDIFKKINRNEEALHSASSTFLSRYSSSLQEANVFIRNDRVSFLLKNSDKNKFNGYQYGTSASGLATYVEPEQFIELNNNRISLENDKLEEVNKLLKELTYYVSRYADSYILNFESLMKLDVIFSKAKYGFYRNGVISLISDDDCLYIKDVFHPMLDIKSAISNTYSLKKPYQGIVISGTNTGGKTVGLKIIGLSVLMSYLGIPVLASQSIIPLFNNVYIDIDDNQSIYNALSTFSAHISNINSILNSADNNSLVLIDELISGTDPKEAQAISLAILERILSIKSKFVITTHYDDIKQFAYNNEHIMLSSVGFNLEELKPTYKYLENSIGVSNAIDIASRYFDDQSIIFKAREYIELNKSKEDKLLEKLGEEINKNELLKDKLDEEIKLNKDLNKQLQEQIDTINKEKNDIKQKYIKELKEYLEEVRIEAKEKLESINETKNIKVINEFIDNTIIEDETKEEVIFEVNDSVKVGESSNIGTILSINGDKVDVNINGMVIKTKIDNLTKLKNVKKKETYKPKQKLNRVSSEINLVGERVEDALVTLDNYLDSAFGAGLPQVKVIHGFGTGQLRNGIRNHLKKLKFVNEFSNGDSYDGGSNVTIVKFKNGN